MQKILIAVDGPEDATDTVPLVTNLARAFDSTVLVAHFRERITASAGTLERESIPQSVAFGERVARRLVDSGVSTTLEIRATSPDRVGEDLLSAARTFGADLIVIGPHHAHGVRQRLFGDIGRILAHGSDCPVLLMPSGAT